MRFLLKLFIFLAILGIIFLTIGYLYYSSDVPDIESFNKRSDKKVVQINFDNGEPIISYGNIYRYEVEFYELPSHLINAVVATEDHRFFNHGGFDAIGIIRAFYVNQKSGRIVQGASTITQQLAKLLFLSPERTFKRKIQELILAHKLENRFSKEQILTLYLNNAYFGSGNYGIAAAAEYYFSKDVSKINLKEAALMVGLLKAPSKLSPKNDPELAEIRASQVLSNMIKYDFISEKNLKEIDNDVIYKTNRLQRLYFSDFVHDQFDDYLSKTDLKKDKIIVNTTLNQKIQEKLEDEINKFVDKNSKKLEKSEIAIVVMNKNGAILAMSGGKNYQKSQFNRAVYSKRQMGSVFKTFVYLSAFENGFTPQDIFEDKKIEFSNWIPNNYEGKYFGKVSLKYAFANSLNSVAIQLAQKVGTKEIAKTAKKLGITSAIEKNDLSAALGTTEVNLYELTGAYASILNDSTPVILYSINDIVDKNDKVLYKRESSGFAPVLKESTSQYGKEILRAVIESGTGKKANVADNIYGKTGTSQSYRDAWFVGFNDQFVIGIWIGNDDNSSTNQISGGSLPAELFAGIIERI